MNNDTKNVELIVYKELKRAIITRQYQPNSQLVESTIAEKMGVSRTPIRSALKKLAYEGLVNMIPRKGAFVAQTSIEEFLNLFSCRLLLEKEAAALAAKHISPKDLDYFEQLMKEEKNSYQNRDLENFILVNNKIHMLIAEVSMNKYYAKFIEELLMKSNIYLIFYDDFYTKPIEDLNSIEEHNLLFDALKSRNPDKSAYAMECHIKSIFENLKLAKIHI